MPQAIGSFLQELPPMVWASGAFLSVLRVPFEAPEWSLKSCNLVLKLGIEVRSAAPYSKSMRSCLEANAGISLADKT